MTGHICSFSTGLSSALTTERVLSKYGAGNVRVVFMDTTIEHEDNYRFFDDVEKRWQQVYGLEKIIVLRDGRSPYEVADDENMIFNQRRHPCTRILKIEPFMRWLKSEINEPATIHIGIDYSEVHRCAAIRRNYEAAGYGVDFPLLWRPVEHRPYTEVCQQDWGIEPPVTYAMGFSHANCLGKDEQGRGGCVAFGIQDRVRQHINFPEVTEATAVWELNTEAHQQHGYALLRDQSNGTVTPRTLRDVIDEYEASQNKQPSLFDAAGCIHCGIGDFLS